MSAQHSTVAPPSGLVALAFTDLEGSSALSERLGGEFEPWRDHHFQLLREPLLKWKGYEVETAGDSLYAVFERVEFAAQWAIEAQHALESFAWPVELGALRVRIGIHVGEPFVGRDATTGRPTYRGPATNRTARLMGAAHGGQSVISEAMRGLMGRLGDELEVRDLGVHRLKGVGDERIFQLGAGEFGPLQTLSLRRHNLPLPPAPMVGRQKQAEQWRELLLAPETRLLTLCGFGGLGKTRMALHLAESVAENFADGVWWVALEQVKTKAEMMTAIAASLPFERAATAPLLDQIADYLSGRRVLLVLDNTEQIEAAADVAGALLGRVADAKILVTTRHRLHLRGEKTREVLPLEESEAARLFCDHAACYEVMWDADDAMIRAIARRVDCVPLALELAASFAPILSPRQILEGLGDQLKLLKSRIPDLPPRQRALRATMDWSYEMLDEEQREIFAQLAVFAGGFGLSDATIVTDSPAVLFAIQELHGRSLLRGTPPTGTGDIRYSMLESVRAYASEKLAATPDGGAGIRARHARHFAGLLEGFVAQLRTRDEAAALRAAQIDFDNAHAALGWAEKGDDALLVARLALGLGRLLQRYGRLREAGERFQTGLDVLGAAPTETALSAALALGRGDAFFDVFEWDEADEFAHSALEQFETLSDRCGAGEARNLLGLIALRGARDAAAARDFFEAVMADFRASHQPVSVAIAQANLGLAYHQSGEFQAARAHLEAALGVYRAADYGRGAAESLTNLGVLEQEQGNLDAADKNYRAALPLELSAGGGFGVARSLSNLGEIALERGDFERACRILAAGTQLFERAGSPHQSYSLDLLEQARRAHPQNSALLPAQLADKSIEELAALAN